MELNKIDFCKKANPAFRIIRTKKELQELQKELGARPDWHEPDEQNLKIDFSGNDFDNAGFPTISHRIFGWVDCEYHLIIFQNEFPVAAINIASLLGWACDTYQ